MISTEQHLRPEQVNAWVDDEATVSDAPVFEQHLATCHACTLQVLSALELKRAAARAGRRLKASPAALARITAQVQRSTMSPRLSAGLAAAWSAIAACLVLAVGLAVWQAHPRPEPLSAELLDQHLVALSSAALPQVVSTDRHTVKPWFQGKLPFSFNLPEPVQLPPNTTLRGADLAFVHGQPAALLLFTIGKHQASVFLMQRDKNAPAIARSSILARSGFTIDSHDAGYLTVTAVSDVNPADLHALVLILVQVQAPTGATGTDH